MLDTTRDTMREVLRLTRQGRLREATALIQTALGAGTVRATPSQAPISVEPTLLPDVTAITRPSPTSTASRFLADSYTGAAGVRAYKTYLPRGYRDESLPLVVMLHGCKQHPDSFADATQMNELADSERFVVVYPAQSTSANSSRCWNWFQAADQHRDRGEPALIAGITRTVIARYGLDPQRVFVAGLSAGGAMATVMSHVYPELFAAVAVHSGLAYQSASDVPAAFAVMRRGGPRVMPRGGTGVPTSGVPPIVPTIVFQGDRDATVHASNAQHIIAEALARAAQRPGGALRELPAERVTTGSRAATLTRYVDAAGALVLEQWIVHGAGHAWFGGRAGGSYADPLGPDATREMLRFFVAANRHDAEPKMSG